MRNAPLAVLLLVCAVVGLARIGSAQDPAQAPQSGPQAVAPTLVRLDGELRTPTGEPRTGSVLMVISLYAEEQDATPLWIEHQLVTLDSAGRYSVLAGATLPEGLPREFFLSNTALWLGIGVVGEPEQPRMRIVTIPYALKAGDADTLGGKAATDFVLADKLKDVVNLARTGQVSGTSTSAPATRIQVDSDAAAGSSSALPPDVGANDVVVTSNQDVQGSLCVGLDCVNPESFGFATLKLKENNTRLLFEDTSVGSFPANDWQLTANDSTSGGGNYFALEDITGAKVPFNRGEGAAADLDPTEDRIARVLYAAGLLQPHLAGRRGPAGGRMPGRGPLARAT